jgi:hypothetical protein
VLATDVVADVVPPKYPDFGIPVHTIGMWAMGLWLIDSCYLEPLAQVCAEVGRWEGFVTVAPLVLENGTGSPVNPIFYL